MAGRRLALIVATDKYNDPGLRQLRAPAKDAEALAGVLADPELGEFEVDIVRNETSSTIGERVETLLTSAKLDDLIVMHFSCHGLKDDSGELYLAATNTRPNLLASTAVDAGLVNRLIARSRARRVVLFLDCCYGGAFERGVIHRAGGAVDVADQFHLQDQELGGGRGRVVITASNAMEFAFEGTDLADTIESQPSIFTGALVEGLASGEADRDQDGMVSLGELYEYVFERVRKESPSQTPGKWEFGVQGELVLAKNPQRVIVPAPVTAELLELVDHPFPATRLGSVEALARLAEGTNLSIAAGARTVLERMANDDSRSVAAAAAEVLDRTTIRVNADSINLGTVARGDPVVSEILIEGAPLAVASRVEASTPMLRVRRIDRAIRIEADTTTAGPIDGVVTIAGPAGTAQIHVVGAVEAPPALRDPGPERAAPIADEAGPAEPATAAEAAPRVRQERTAEPEPSAALQGGSVPDSTAEHSMATAATTQAPTERQAIATTASFRGLLGAMIGGFIGDIWYFNSQSDWKFSTWDWTFSNVLLIVDIVAMATAVVIAEIVVPAVRVPDGKAYGPLRHRHLPAAAAQGAVVGVIVGAVDLALVFGAYFQTEERFLIFTAYSQLIVTGVSIAIGFALAQAALLRTRLGP